MSEMGVRILPGVQKVYNLYFGQDDLGVYVTGRFRTVISACIDVAAQRRCNGSPCAILAGFRSPPPFAFDMANLSDIAKLICGGSGADEAAPGCEVAQVMLHLRAVLESTLEELQWLAAESAPRIALYGPFLVRSLLEVAVTAFAGRLDPTRVLVVKRTQEHGAYDTGKAWNSAMRWQGDVVDEKVTELWTPKRHYREMTKALFGDYYVEIYWTVALRLLSDTTASGGDWLAAIRGKTASQFATARRELISKLYSESSKGVHAEFVIPPGSMYDRMTVANLASQAIQLLSEIGLLINLLPHIAYRLPQQDAIEVFNGLETIEVMQ
jgi:hypothetical protein